MVSVLSSQVVDFFADVVETEKDTARNEINFSNVNLALGRAHEAETALRNLMKGCPEKAKAYLQNALAASTNRKEKKYLRCLLKLV